MAGMPLALALPAAASAAAYLDARLGISTDIKTIGTALGTERHTTRAHAADRINVFFRFEELALDPSSAHRAFLVLPADTVQAGEQRQWTYKQAYDTVLKHAAWLSTEHGIQRGDVVALDYTNKPQFVWWWFALWSVGAKPAFINSNLRDKAFVHCVRVSTARIVLIDPAIREVLTDTTIQELGPDDKGRAIDPLLIEDSTTASMLSLPPYRAPDSARTGVTPTTTALLIYTSGTTGLPKAAIVPWAKAHAGLYAFSRTMSLTPSDRYYSSMPLYHSSASLLCVCACLGPGCTYILSPKFSPRTFMPQIAAEGATAMQYIGEMCRYLLSAPPRASDKNHKLKIAIGNGLRPDVWHDFRTRFAIPLITEFYGATEGPGATIVQSRNSFTQGCIGFRGSAQRLLARSTTAFLRFDTESDTPVRNPKTGFCERTNTDEAGEFVNALDPASIEDKFLGYLGNSKASDSKVIRNVFKKGDAWYRTGDLLRQDSEGRLWFVDRIGDTFRWKGENVSTAEVAEALGTHPAIREANIYGVQLPGHDGRAGCAAVILRDGSREIGERLGRDVARHVRERLPKYAVPIFLRVVGGEFEVTGTQKQQKVGLRNEGVDPGKVGDDRVVWLAGDGYKEFRRQDWEGLVGGKVKL